jgi:hypothetical protein
VFAIAGFLTILCCLGCVGGLLLRDSGDDKQASPATTAAAKGSDASATSTAAQPTSSIPGYRDQPLSLTPQSCDVHQPSIDFDEPAVFENYAQDSRTLQSADLWYETCRGSIQQRGGAFIGNGPPQVPQTAACRTAAKTIPIGRQDVRSLHTGMAWCVITNSNRVVWVKISRIGAPMHTTLDDGPIPTIHLIATVLPND